MDPIKIRLTEVDSPGYLDDIIIWERATGVKIMTSLSQHASHQLTHVCRVAVFRGGSG